MNKGYLKKLNEKGFDKDQIQEQLKEVGVILEVRTSYSAPLVLSPPPKKQSIIRRVKNALFRKQNDVAVRSSKYKYQEYKVPIELKNPKEKIYYTKDFKTEVYYYLTGKFDSLIRYKFQELIRDFTLDYENFSDATLKNEVVNQTFVKVFRSIVGEKKVDMESFNSYDVLPDQESYFSQLKKHQNNLIKSIDAYPELIEKYLLGEESIIEQQLIESCEVIEEIIDFDYRFKFLVALNRKYTIEDASSVLIGEKYKEIFSNYPKVFETVDVAKFTYDTIEGLDKEDDFKSHLGCLYQALYERKFVGKNKTDFLRYIEKYHGVKSAPIRPIDKKSKNPNRTRFENFLSEIDVHFPPKND